MSVQKEQLSPVRLALRRVKVRCTDVRLRPAWHPGEKM